MTYTHSEGAAKIVQDDPWARVARVVHGYDVYVTTATAGSTRERGRAYGVGVEGGDGVVMVDGFLAFFPGNCRRRPGLAALRSWKDRPQRRAHVTAASFQFYRKAQLHLDHHTSLLQYFLYNG